MDEPVPSGPGAYVLLIELPAPFALEVGARPGMKGKMIVAILPSFAERYLTTDLFEGM